MPCEPLTSSACLQRPAGRRRWAATVAVLVLSLTAALPSVAAGTGALHCVLKAPARAFAGQPLMLQFTLTNRGSTALDVLQWNTPFEGWFGGYVRVLRDGVELPYRGPRLKRGEPPRSAYFRLRPGQSRIARVDLALPFDLAQPGYYRVEPQMVLFDVVAVGQGTVPRSRDLHAPGDLACNAVEIEVVSGPPKKS